MPRAGIQLRHPAGMGLDARSRHLPCSGRSCGRLERESSSKPAGSRSSIPARGFHPVREECQCCVSHAGCKPQTTKALEPETPQVSSWKTSCAVSCAKCAHALSGCRAPNPQVSELDSRSTHLLYGSKPACTVDWVHVLTGDRATVCKCWGSFASRVPTLAAIKARVMLTFACATADIKGVLPFELIMSRIGPEATTISLTNSWCKNC